MCEPGRQLRSPSRHSGGPAAATIASSRGGLVVSTTSRDVLHDGFALRFPLWGGLQRRPSNPHLAKPPIEPPAFDHAAKLSLLCRAFWPAILSAAFGEPMGYSRAGANRRPCGLALATDAPNHSAKLPWAQGAAI